MEAPQMIDLTNAQYVEVEIRQDVTKRWTNIWINVDGICRLRIEGFQECIVTENSKSIFYHGELKLLTVKDVNLQEANSLIGKRLDELLEKYGPDFFKKLPMYKTAKLNDQWIAIRDVNVNSLTATIESADHGIMEVSITDLNDFCL